jgi:serine phosphatase RsbU (regulator of sigma subunit)
MKEDLMNAKIIQQNILSHIQQANNLSFYIEYRPLFEVGGDIYDIYPRNDGTTRIFLADATGHGVVASLITMLIKAEYEKLKNTDIKPNEIFKSINDTFYKTYSALNMYFTGIIIDIDPGKGRIAYSSAGHPVQYLIRNGGLITLSRSGRAVGIFEEINSKTIEIAYMPGDKILLFTDGLFEEFDVHYKEFGENRLQEIIADNHLKSAKDIVNTIIEHVIGFVGDAPYNDDITAIGIE